MPTMESDARSLHERTLDGMQQVLEHGLSHVRGFELFVVRQAVQSLHPRVEQRIRGASEEELRTELKYLHDLLGTILQEESTKRAHKAQSRRRPGRRTASGGSRKTIARALAR